ncbi:MAG: hypothetical protein D6834_03225 [Aquificota bacterium]|nr:MAG: hypothetical protein D6834_03225 [Aquificota bacterium]
MKDILVKLFEQIDPNKEIINESKREEFLTLLDEKVKELKEQAYNEALEKIDEEHTEMLEQVLEKIDNEHTEMLEQVVEKVKSDAEEVLEKTQVEPLVEAVSDYLDEYLEETIPVEKIEESVEQIKYKRLFEAIKETLVAYDISLDEELKEAVIDGKNTIEEKEKELNDALYEKVKIQKEYEELKKQFLLEQKTKGLDSATKSYVEKYIEDADIDELEEKINEAIDAYTQSEKDRARNSIPSNAIITEGKEFNGNKTMAEYYAEIGKKMSRFIK